MPRTSTCPSHAVSWLVSDISGTHDGGELAIHATGACGGHRSGEMSMTCRELNVLLPDYLAGELPSDVKPRCEAHLARCASCLAYLHGYRAAMRLARQACRRDAGGPDDLPEALLQGILESVRAYA